MVEVFVTDIPTIDFAIQVHQEIQELFPAARITFDLEDCDRILKIEDDDIDSEQVIHLVSKLGFMCRMLV
jgi:hypothetical protein